MNNRFYKGLFYSAIMIAVITISMGIVVGSFCPWEWDKSVKEIYVSVILFSTVVMIIVTATHDLYED